jgi:tRNA-Thr(GGU) m(6)t(6)A37 methyltransferase TsaA
MATSKVTLDPIGYVRSPEKKSRRGSFDEVVAEIVVSDDLVEALEGLGEFSHLEVIYYMHVAEPDREFKPTTHPMGLRELPRVGLFATRSPHRPNPIGLTLCELLSIEGNRLTVRGLDALDGSPVLDIKGPSRRDRDLGATMRFPAWTERIAALRDRGGK